MSVAELGYKIDSSGAVVAAANLDDMTAAAVRAEAGADRMAAGQRKLGAATARSGVNMRMLAPQLSQIGQMYTATGQLGQAVAVQAADIGLAFGVAGTIIGTVAGIALPALLSSMTGASNATDEFKKAIEDANSAMEEYVSLAKEVDRNNGKSFEAAADNVRMVSDAYRDLIAIAKIEALNSINAATVELAESVTNYSYSLGAIGDAGDLLDVETQLRGNITVWKENREEVGLFVDALNEMKNAADLSDRYEAAVRVRDIFKSTVDVSGEMSDRQIEFWKNLSSSVYQMELLGAAVKSAEGQTFDWASAMASVGDEISAIMSNMSSLTGGVIGNAAKQTEIDALRAGKSIRDAARAATDFKAQTEFDAREQGANMFERLIISGERYQHERGMQLDAELDREREAARERDKLAGGARPFELGVSDIESTIEGLRLQSEVVSQWYTQSQEALRMASDEELAIIGGRNEAKLRLEQEYNERRAALAAIGEETKLSLTLGGASDVLSAIGQFNEKAFKLAKVAAAAQALVSTLQGSAEALKLPYPYNLIAAAQVAAKGFGLVAAIKGVSSSGGSASISAGGTSSAAGVTATSAAAEVAPQTNAIIQVESGRSRFTVEEINDIITGIQSESEDGVIISGIQTA